MAVLFVSGLIGVLVLAAYPRGAVALGLSFVVLGSVLMLLRVATALPWFGLMLIGAGFVEFGAASAMRALRSTDRPARSATIIAEVVGLAGYGAVAVTIAGLFQLSASIGGL